MTSASLPKQLVYCHFLTPMPPAPPILTPCMLGFYRDRMDIKPRSLYVGFAI